MLTVKAIEVYHPLPSLNLSYHSIACTFIHESETYIRIRHYKQLIEYDCTCHYLFNIQIT